MRYDDNSDNKEIIISTFAINAFGGEQRVEMHLKLDKYVQETQESLENVRNELDKDVNTASDKILAQLKEFAFLHHPKLLAENKTEQQFRSISPDSVGMPDSGVIYTSLSRYFTIESKATTTYLLSQEREEKAKQRQQFDLLAYTVNPAQEEELVVKVMNKINEGDIGDIFLEEGAFGRRDKVILFPQLLFTLHAKMDFSVRRRKQEKLTICNLRLIDYGANYGEPNWKVRPTTFSSNQERRDMKQLIDSLEGRYF
ncbi:hypothetical protein HYU21_04425, partial [Candidatus Woesearchaeota archaeon]|nr:hypothetical protein [Candidatus Woesearchaeota archaeon]